MKTLERVDGEGGDFYVDFDFVYFEYGVLGQGG
jgi:hypothetical protein